MEREPEGTERIMTGWAFIVTPTSGQENVRHFFNDIGLSLCKKWIIDVNVAGDDVDDSDDHNCRMCRNIKRRLEYAS